LNYAQARLRQSDGRWDWTVRNDDLIRPTGYCRGWDDTPLDEVAARIGMPLAMLEQDRAQHEPFRDKYHTDGHATKQEAERCFRDYQLDHELHELRGPSDEQHRCQAMWRYVDKEQQGRVVATVEHYEPAGPESCMQWTQHAMAIGGYSTDLTWLCDGHRKRDIFGALHPFRAGTSSAYS
jgi:hypothetical protein